MSQPARDDASPLFQADDFRSLQTHITLENTTTQTVIKNGKRTMAGELDPKSKGQDLRVLLVEVLSEESPPVLALEVPHRTCAEGHTLQVNLVVTGPKNLKFNLTVIARVKSSEKVADGRDRIVASLVQPDMENWNRFLAVFTTRQSETEDLFRRMKDSG